MLARPDINNTWITSDLHLGHDRDFIWGPRGFNSVEEHDTEIIRLWNETVPKDANVYVLGDLILGDTEAGLEKLKQLNGNIYITIGNHDTDSRIEDYLKQDNVMMVQMGYRFNIKKMAFIFSHYPTIVTNIGQEKPIINLCGHSHTQDRWLHAEHGCYHVELDAHDNKPVLLADIIADIKGYKRNGEA